MEKHILFPKIPQKRTEQIMVFSKQILKLVSVDHKPASYPMAFLKNALSDIR